MSSWPCDFFPLFPVHLQEKIGDWRWYIKIKIDTPLLLPFGYKSHRTAKLKYQVSSERFSPRDLLRPSERELTLLLVKASKTHEEQSSGSKQVSQFVCTIEIIGNPDNN